ncbi:MAG: hypothetical protein COB15_09550 [Flavobacteriales bacterium]|nr:MAG: hypothetical protein COB15_09550 [Flavobacteriales bacterium]
MEPTFIILAVLAAISAGSSIMLNKKLKKALAERDHAIGLGANMAQRSAMLEVSRQRMEKAILSDDPILIEKCKYKIEADKEEVHAANNIFNQ